MAAAGRVRTLILGAAGRDFHDFNVLYRDDPETEVVVIGPHRVVRVEC
jgi:predicted GTPase